MKKEIIIALLAALFIGAATGSVGAYFVVKTYQPTQNELIAEYYDVENAALVSPHSLRKKMGEGKNDFVLVDLRSEQEYNTSHIIGAINIPAYKNPDKSVYGDVDRIVASFKELPQDKEIIVYCYSAACMTGRKIGKMLTENEIYVKHLGVGWNEWRYYWNLWNHDGETQVNASNYIVSGSEPGALKGTNKSTACPISGEFGC